MSIAHRCDLCKRIVDEDDLKNYFSISGIVTENHREILVVGFLGRMDVWQSSNLSIRKQKSLNKYIDVCNECLLNIKWKIK